MNIKQIILDNKGIENQIYPGYQHHDGLWFENDKHQSYLNLAKEINNEIIIPNNIKIILELGCGAGSLSYHLRELNKNIIICTLDGNVETSNKSPYISKEYHFCILTDGKYELIDDNDKIIKFDLVLSFEHFEHIQEDKLDIFFENIKNHIHNKSKILATASTLNSGVHVCVKKKEEWLKYLELNDFEIIQSNFIREDTTPFNFSFYDTNELYFKLK